MKDSILCPVKKNADSAHPLHPAIETGSHVHGIARGNQFWSVHGVTSLNRLNRV